VNDVTPKGVIVPSPDPTVLTTEALLREVLHVKELFTERVDGLEDKLESYQQSHTSQHRYEVQEAIQHLTELCAERFDGIKTQFVERDSRSKESTQSSKDAIAAALAAQKEAVEKSEKATEKELDSIKTNFDTTIKSIEIQLNDLKSNINKAGGEVLGQRRTQDEGARNISIIIAAVSAVVAIVSVVGLFIGLNL